MFHDNKEDATLIMNNIEKLAEIIARGICEYLKVPFAEKEVVKEVDKFSTVNKDIFYRVVTGSFNNRNNANDRIAELKKAGFESFIAIE